MARQQITGDMFFGYASQAQNNAYSQQQANAAYNSQLQAVCDSPAPNYGGEIFRAKTECEGCGAPGLRGARCEWCGR